MFTEVKSRKGLATRSSQSETEPFSGHESEDARCALTMLPPETEDRVCSWARMPSSLSRRNAPR